MYKLIGTSYGVIGVPSAEKEIYTVRMVALYMDDWRETDFNC